MEDQKLERFIPEHPLPQEIQAMKKDDTVCQFCGVSYLIHNEMKALEERVKEAERQMEYYKGSVEREEKLKIKVASMEEESDKLSRALQASEERTKILAVDLTSKKEQIGNLKQQTKDLENELQRKQEAVTRAQLKFTDLVKLFSILQQELKTQRATLSDIKVAVQKNHKSALEHHKKLVINVDLLCKKFAEEKCALEDSLRKFKNDIKMQQETIANSDALTQVLKEKCLQLEVKVSEQEKELVKAKEHNTSCNNEMMCYKELIKSKTNDLNNYKEKLQTQEETFKQETKKKQGDLLSKEKQIQELLENCRDLEKRVAEFTNARNVEEEESVNSLEEIKTLKESLMKAKGEVTCLKEEREMMISAHHNRIEQLRESFKKKMEEADAWPGRLDQIVKEKEAQFHEEKNNMWKELTDAFQKEMDEEQQKHIAELALWKKEAKAAQDKFREDITVLNRKHREEVKRLEQAANETKVKSEQSRYASNSIIKNLEAKIVDRENRMRQPSLESAEEVAKLRNNLQESEKMLEEAEKQIGELETKKQSWMQEVAFLQETVRRECEERLELTDALGEARAQLLALQRTSGASFSRNKVLNSSSSTSSSSLSRGSAKGLASNGLSDTAGSQATSCPVGFDGGVGYRPGSGSHDAGRKSRGGSVDDSRQRIAAAVRRSGSKSRLGENFSS